MGEHLPRLYLPVEGLLKQRPGHLSAQDGADVAHRLRVDLYLLQEGLPRVIQRAGTCRPENVSRIGWKQPCSTIMHIEKPQNVSWPVARSAIGPTPGRRFRSLLISLQLGGSQMRGPDDNTSADSGVCIAHRAWTGASGRFRSFTLIAPNTSPVFLKWKRPSIIRTV